LKNVRKNTKPREVNWFEVKCALLYVLKGGIQSRRLPKDFPKWNAVYSYFVRWKCPGKQGICVLEPVLKQPVGATRIQEGLHALTPFLIIDSQNVLVGGYTGEPFAQALSAIQVAKRSELQRFEVILKHWVVERSFA
jgi:hypothetical protein